MIETSGAEESTRSLLGSRRSRSKSCMPVGGLLPRPSNDKVIE